MEASKSVLLVFSRIVVAMERDGMCWGQVRQIQKKLQQVDILEARQQERQVLDSQQISKLKQKGHLLKLQSLLAAGEELSVVLSLLNSHRCESE